MCLAIAKYKGVVVPHDYLRTAMRANPDGAGFAYHEDGGVHIAKGFTKIEDFMSAWVPHEQKTAIIHFRWTTHGSNSRANCHPFELADGALIHNGVISGMGDSKYDFGSASTWPASKVVIGPVTGKPHDRYGTYKERQALALELIHTAHGLQDDTRGWALAADLLASEQAVLGEKRVGLSALNDVIEAHMFVLEDTAAVKERDLRSDTREFCEDYLAGWTEDMLRKGKKMIERAIGGGSKLATLHNSGRIQLFNENSGHWNEGAWYSNGCYKQTSAYTGHIPTGAKESALDATRYTAKAGPVREYVADHAGKLRLVEKQPKKASGADAVELRPAKDNHRSAFLDTMVDGLLESERGGSSRDWLAEFPHLTAMSLYEGD